MTESWPARSPACPLSPEQLDHLLALAVTSAGTAAERGDDPFGAVIADVHSGQVLAHAGNEVRTRADPLAHAEVVAVRSAGNAGSGTVAVTSCEPCLLCGVALRRRGVEMVVSAASREDAERFGFTDVIAAGATRRIFRDIGLVGMVAHRSDRLAPFDLWQRLRA